MTAALPTIVVHIGHGKTGTSSIQQALEANRFAIEEQGGSYLGYMLENCQEACRIERVELGLDQFQGKDPAEFNSLLFDVLSHEARHGAERGLRRLIWSNESILPRSAFVVPALDRLRESGVPVEVIYYVRRHDAWAQSAYFQWGIRHKPYHGPVRPFRQWVDDRNIAYAHKIRPWIEALGNDVRVFNFDAAGDVVRHFFGHNGLSVEASVNTNEGRTAEDLVIWAGFNSWFEREVLPRRLERLFQARDRLGDYLPGLPAAESLFPSDDDLGAVRDRYADDVAAMNRLLIARGEPPLDLSVPIRPRPPVDQRHLADTLFRLFLVAYREASIPERSGWIIPVATPEEYPGGGTTSDDPSWTGPIGPWASATSWVGGASDLSDRLRAVEEELRVARSRPFRTLGQWAFFRSLGLAARLMGDRRGMGRRLRETQARVHPQRAVPMAEAERAR